MHESTDTTEIVPAAHRKGMALKNLIARHKKRRDAGIGIVDTIVGIGLAALVIGGPIIFFTVVNQGAAGNAATQAKNTSISEALDRTVASVQSADSILYAAPNELVVRSTEVDPGQPDKPVITRWVVSGTVLFQQAWTGDAGVAAYDRSALPTAAAGSTDSITRVSVDGLKLDKPLFGYNNKDGGEINVTAPADALTEQQRTNPADNLTSYDIALVKIGVTASTIKDGVVENATSAAPRSVSGKSDGALAAPQCPAVTLSTSADGDPVVTWNTMPGYTSYVVMRNNGQAAVVSAAATDAQKSWTDTTVTPGPVEVVSYRVQAQNPDGSTASIACTPKNWSPQIAAPAFKNSTVLPAADEAHEWTDGTDGALGLKKPRIVLKWDAVPGADSYDLKYRQLDPASGAPLTAAYSSAAAGLPAATTTFTWDDGGWATSYEWYIIANAKTGQSVESAHITTLTHPAAPQNVVIKAEYGSGASYKTTGKNVITWDAAQTAVGYDIWKYTSGSTGAVTRIGQVNSATRTFTDDEPYGTTVTYYVAAINDGPRGNTSGKASSANPEAGVVAATGTMPTVSRRVPAGSSPVITTASYKGTQNVSFERATNTTPVDPAPKPVSQLQYPPIPDVAAVSAAAGQTRDLDGKNQVVWAPALSATSYLPARSTVMDSKVVCLAGDCDRGAGGTTATSLTDPAGKGTQYDYYVKAVNPTGVSVEFSAKVRLTQRPTTPVLSVSDAPDLETSGAAFSSKANADDGNDGANKFCTSATCKYELSRNGTPVSTLDQPAAGSGSPLSWSTPSNPDGAKLSFTARSKNAAVTNSGFSDSASVTVDTYPGKFGMNQWLGDRNGNARERFMANLTSTDVEGSSQPVGTPGQTTIAWGASQGAQSMTMTRTAVANESTSTDGSLGLPGPDPVSATWWSGGTDIWSGRAAPGATYRHTVVAEAPNGLKRSVATGNMITPADLPHHAAVQVTCSNNTWSNQTTATWDHPNHYVGARMIELEKQSRYGAWGGTSIWGLSQYKYQGFSQTNGVWLAPWDGNPNINAGPGIPYYYGVTAGFDIQNAGAGGPSSARLRLTMTAMATFNSGCGPWHGTWDSLYEPTWPCYGYVPGQPCQAVYSWNRPQWRTR